MLDAIRKALKDKEEFYCSSWAGDFMDDFDLSVFNALKDSDAMSINGKLYIIKYTPSGGVGMGSYPDRISIKPLENILEL